MAIEKRMIGDMEVGYDTVTHSFCNLPKEMAEAPEPEKPKRGRAKPEEDADDE